jgi:3-phenylpropionate/cinnamic acid dioxygenase small subunit
MTAEEISDDVRNAVTDLLVRYATGIDTRDWTLLRSCFTDDCDADYGDIGHWQGVAEITAWMANAHDPLGPTLHRLSNLTFTREGGRIKARSYVHATLVLPDGSAVHAYGFYDDEIVVDDGGPRIGRRRYTHATTELHQPMGPMGPLQTSGG